MFTLRCTERLRKRGKKLLAPSPEHVEPTTRLGDWYANTVFVGGRHIVVAISERTFLPVVTTVAPLDSMVDRLWLMTGEVLRALDIDEASVDAELKAMCDVRIGKTASRSVTGMLVELCFQAEHAYEPTMGPLDLSLTLAGVPCGTLYKRPSAFPDQTTQMLFASGGAVGRDAPVAMHRAPSDGASAHDVPGGNVISLDAFRKARGR